MLTKYATVEKILDVRSSANRLEYDYGSGSEGGLNKFAALDEGIRENDGYLYVRARAISSRVNKNNDGWPSSELKEAYTSFLGRPVFVDHNNDDPKRTRGVIVSSQLHEEDEEKTSALDPYYSTAPDNHKPPTWIELLIEVDAETFPQLAKEIRTSNIDAVSMGANIDRSVCSVCSNEATTPQEYCSHIKQKGLTFEITADNGEKLKKKSYEDCYGVNFFEISFVFDPADETALVSEKTGKTASVVEDAVGLLASQVGQTVDANTMQYLASREPDLRDGLEMIFAALEPKQALSPQDLMEPIGTEHGVDGDRNYIPQADETTAPQHVDTLRDESLCPVCRASNMEEDPDGIMRCPTCGHVAAPEPLDNPDLSLAQDTDRVQDATDTTNDQGQPQLPVDSGEGNTRGVTFAPVDSPLAAIKTNIANGVMSDMLNVKLKTTSSAEADKLVPITPGKLETTLGTDFGITSGVYKAIAEAGLSAKVTFTDLPTKQASVSLPTDNPILSFLMSQDAAMIGKSSISDVKIVIEADSEAEAEKIAELIRAAQPAQRDAAKRPLLPDNRKPSDVPAERIISDQAQPVTSGASKVGETVTVDGTEYVLAPLPSKEDKPSAEALADEVAEADEKDEPKDEVKDSEDEKKDDSEKDSEDKEARLLQAFKIADEFVSLGLLGVNDKMAFIADLEKEAPEALVAREATLATVKEAGFSKNTTTKVAGVSRVPRLSHTPITAVSGVNDFVPDEAIFL